jgi:UTP--glucose-1-phosphate uridylyltransferase
MKITKAVITAAGRNQRALPLQTLVDRDGVQKSALRIIVEEAVSTGVEEICVVVFPGAQNAYKQAAGDHANRLTFVEQPSPRGYGDALHRARPFTGNDAFLHLVSDHLYLSRGPKRCAQQLVEIAEAESCSVSAVQATRENMLPYYGTVGGRRVPKNNQLYEIETVAEKPTPTEAEQTLIVPGLRAGHYLCFFGMHVLTASVMDILGELVSKSDASNGSNGAGPIQLSHALEQLASKERYLALEVQGLRYNIGVKYGLLFAQLALALDGDDREEILAQLVELSAMRDRTRV